MKALSGIQPWWHAILHLGKCIENRVERSSAHLAMRRHRGPLLLHASAGIGTLADFSDACDSIGDVLHGDERWVSFRDEHLGIRTFRGDAYFIPRASLLRGGIVGRCRVAGLIKPNGEPLDDEARRAIERLKPDMRWHIRGQWGHVLDDVEPLPFHPCKGALGLWEFDERKLEVAQ